MISNKKINKLFLINFLILDIKFILYSKSHHDNNHSKFDKLIYYYQKNNLSYLSIKTNYDDLFDNLYLLKFIIIYYFNYINYNFYL